ncbi:MAG: DUF5057 domain-containing protein [Eubacterium sp.]|nr:DUF5057 domain-containing protein [Eubacterium sp.]
MRKVNKKILVAALSLLLIACAFVTILSFTMAADDDDNSMPTVVSASPDFDVVTTTNIDRIVKNSHEGTDKVFHIVEISSGSYSAMNDTAKTYDVFQNLIFNGYKTIDEMMADGCVDYTPWSISELTSETAIQNCIDNLIKADLIYVHNDPNNVFTEDNKIPELIKLQLCSAAVGDYVPFIIDGPIATQDDIIKNSNFYNDLVTNVFKKYGGKRYTYAWNPSTDGTAKQFFNHETSAYIQIRGDKQKDVWQKIYALTAYDGTNAGDATPPDATKDYYVVNDSYARLAKVLVINGNGTESGSISDLTKAGLTEVHGLRADEAQLVDGDGNVLKLVEQSAVTPITDKLYKIDNTSDLYFAYAGKYTHPSYVSYKYCAYNAAELATIDYSQYDFVIVESGVNGKVIDNSVYEALYGTMMANQHILYDKSLINSSGTSTGSGAQYDENYMYICGKVMTSTESPKYDNILVTSGARMNVYMSATDKGAVKDIADIINSGSFRGIGGGDGDSSNLYTVLEIEPSYPIDRKLAGLFAKIDGSTHVRSIVDPLEHNDYDSEMTFEEVTGRIKPMYQNGGPNETYGQAIKDSWYYLRNQGVLNGVTSDEISYDGETSLTSFLESGEYIKSSQLNMVTDYYAWKISKAKVAHVTGLDYDQVNVVHMSSYEFNATKKTVLDNFDVIYIGGDNSGIKATGSFQTSKLSSIGLNVYNMYFTEGDGYDYTQNYGKSEGSVGTLQANDISKNKYDELMEYKRTGMPVVIGKDAVAGLNATNAIDPDSNMYKFLTSAQADKANGKDNIVWNFDYDDTIKIANAGGMYGNTYGGYVTVFAGREAEDYLGNAYAAPTGTGVNEIQFKDALDRSAERPKLVVTSCPPQYKEGDESTWITDRTVQFSYEAAGGSGFTGRLYIDDNANSRFEADEVVDFKDGAKGTLKKKFDADFFGVVYWKLEVSNNSGAKASTTGCMKIKRTTQDKIQVNLLQIMPDDKAKGSDNSDVSLYLCTECQQSRYVLYGNRYTDLKKNHIDSILKLTGGFQDGVSHATLSAYPTDPVVNGIKNYITNAQNVDSAVYLESMPSYGGSGEFDFNVKNNFGIHEHRFGIVKYDSTLVAGNPSGSEDGGKYTGVDNWNTNWFRDVKFDYNVDMNVIYLSEFQNIVEDIDAAYSGKDTSAINTLRSKYAQASVDFKNAYTGMKKVINDNIAGLTTSEKSALQRFMFRADGFGLGVVPTEAQITTITDDANNQADLRGLVGDVRNEFVASYVESELNRIRYSNFDTVMAKYAESAPNVISYLNTLKANGSSLNGKSSAALVSEEIDYELSYDTYDEMPFYDLFSLCGENSTNSSDLVGYAKVYSVWRDAKIYEQFFRKMWQYYALYAGVDDSGKVNLEYYNCIVFGAAQNFCGADMTSNTAIDAIIHYINDGGQTMLFYDSLTSNSTVNMTNRLSSYFGMNAHTTSVVEEPDPSGEETYEGTITIKLGNGGYSTWNDGILSTYSVSTAATEVNIVIDDNGNNDFANNPGTRITITDDATSHPGNFGKHNITVKYKFNNKNIYYCPGFTIWVNGKDYGKVCDTNGAAEGSVKFSNSVVNDPIESGGDNGGGATGPLALNPSKLTYATALGQSDAGTKPMFDYCLYWPELEAEGKTHPRKDMLKFAVTNRVATNAAAQNNEGIVTMYPFSIGANLRITPTVEGDFTCNVADENLIVYYSLSGGTSGTMSSNYVANPMDGGNNYFVYQYQPGGNNAGTVTYLGAGRTVITGYRRENNDERRFFINLILNTGRKSTKSTTLNLYDHSSSQVISGGIPGTASLTNNTVQENGTLGYKMIITEGSLPEFSYMVMSDSTVEISEVWAYFDLDYDEGSPDDEYHDGDGNHVLVYNKTYSKKAPYIASGYLAYVDNDTAFKGTPAEVNGVMVTPSLLEIKDSYMYNNEYTYIVVKVKDTKGNVYFQRLKIILKPELHELT